MTDLITRAAPYIGMGWKVFPVVPRSRKFFTKEDRHGNIRYPELGPKGGFHWARSDPAWIECWQCDLGPDCNLAVATGAASGIVGIDLDLGKGPQAQDALARLAAQGKHFPPTTAVVATPSGGAHWYYRYRGPLKNSAGKLGALPGQPSNIDIRADGGLLYLPPTIREDGKQYVWINVPPFDGQTLPLVPRWLMEDMQPPTPPRTYRRASSTQTFGNDLDRIQWRLEAISNAPEGQRNEVLYRLYAQCLDYGHTPHQVATHFADAAAQAGLRSDEIVKTMAQAEKPDNRRDPRNRRRGAA